MTLQQLKYAIEVARHRSISKAANALFISQPSLSNAIKELEQQLGISIFLRTNKGILVTPEGTEFLSYARQVIEQAELLESKYATVQPTQQHFSISSQHYAFVVSAFARLFEDYHQEKYEFTLRETKTYEIIENVKNLQSEIGVLYMNDFNEQVIQKFLREANLIFYPLFEAKPHVFIQSNHPLALKKSVSLLDLEPYPYLSFEQGSFNSFYFSEEILSTISRPKNIKVSDRATLFNLLIGLNGYTISTGVISQQLNKNICSIPLEIDETMTVGYILHKHTTTSKLASIYIEYLKETIRSELQ